MLVAIHLPDNKRRRRGGELVEFIIVNYPLLVADYCFVFFVNKHRAMGEKTSIPPSRIIF